MGLYGVEATPINCSSLRKLPGRTTDAMVGKHQSMRSPEVALAILGKAGIAVKANILWRQARLMRRAWHHRPEWRGLMTRMWQRIASMFTGQRHPEEDESDGADLAAPAGLVRMAGRRGANLLKKGPCGLLLSSVMRAGGSLTEDGAMLFPGETTVNFLRDPIQWTKQVLIASGNAAAAKRAAARRPSFHHKGRIDYRLSGDLERRSAGSSNLTCPQFNVGDYGQHARCTPRGWLTPRLVRGATQPRKT